MERDEKGRFKKRTRAKVKIAFLSWVGREALEVEADSIKDAVEKSVKDGASLGGADLRGASLGGADLRGADLSCASLGGASLSCASLGGASLRGADLRGASLSGADLRGADLSCASLGGADLRGADLSCASLSGADLRGADLSCASLSGAKCGDKELWAARPVLQLGPCGSVGRQTVVFFFADGSEPLIRCGCFSGGIADFEEKIHETRGGTFHEKEYMAMVEHIKAIHALQKEEKAE